MVVQPVSAVARLGLGRFLWGLLADVATGAITIFWGTLCIALMFITRRGWPADVLAPIWARWILKVCGIRVDVKGLEHVDPGKVYVIVSNHLSNFDIFATLGAVPLKIRFVAKKELLRVPVFGWALALSEHIVIDRRKPDEAIARINARVAGQISEGFCILFYAEGTRSSDGKVHAFKKGAVTLALRTGLPIVPMSISGTHKFLPKRHFVIRPGGAVKIVLGEPIATTGYTLDQRDQLNEQVRHIVIKNFVEYY